MRDQRESGAETAMFKNNKNRSEKHGSSILLPTCQKTKDSESQERGNRMPPRTCGKLMITSWKSTRMGSVDLCWGVVLYLPSPRSPAPTLFHAQRPKIHEKYITQLC